MSYREPARTARRSRSTIVAGLVVISAAIAGVLVHQARVSSSSSAASPIDVLHGDPAPAVTGVESDADERRPDRPGDARPLGEADGAVPDGATVFDDEIPAVGNLDPDLLDALRRAASDAAEDGVEFVVNSGWRSPQYQDRLLREAIAEYGSEEEAARWVSTPETSLHVSGDAVDLGGSDATAWLSDHGAEYGLCQIYRNEPWHYELRTEAVDDGCPSMYADPTHDPRMR
ncbi:M15 family metallopeptidase [Jiangella rhizosphaerae]|uniref:Peptidase M15 n=1 Tax=Jiangella rhizosphaerae TaxID=2293569 RepID=A0A418KKS2_9ACTN|nr:M15 family metallopeptidase [Jiangella rhizosphaerae]RIQ17843.1 peptidase M15 [Jiangella rhizosphaerae]